MSWERVSLVVGALIIASVVLYIATGNYAAAVLSITVAVHVIMLPRLTRQARENGWMAGRAAMAGTLAEALRRGLSPGEWIMAELERDGVQFKFCCAQCGADDVNPATHECAQ